jgi:hypothetical protein
VGWTDWRKIVEGTDRNVPASAGYDGAATYELSLRRSSGGDITIVYVGETLNERERIRDYARGDSPLEARIADALQKGFVLSYRATAQPSIEAAQSYRDALLGKYGYPWNAQGP